MNTDNISKQDNYPSYPCSSENVLSNNTPMNISSRAKITNLLRRRFFITPSFEIYGGTSGLFDLGPPGAALKSEIESLWRKHFIIYDDMLEIFATSLTPYKILKASGHVDRFTDLMVKDLITQEAYRADQYLEDVLENKIVFSKPFKLQISDEYKTQLLRAAGSLSKEEMGNVYKELGIKSPIGNDLSDPYPFNLMFQTNFGAPKVNIDSNADVAFLRPETAQGIFVNFKRLLEFNGGKIPFATAQLGISYRNEIAPRNGLLRVREFPMAEIEHFVHPENKNHPKFHTVESLIIPLYPRISQKTDGKIWTHMTIKDAIDNNILLNQTHAYFLARTYLFLLKCGISKEGIRFRQHLEDEMSHYASDCWDAEILSSYGWIEVAGHADRAAYDLTCHSKESNQSLTALHKFNSPVTMTYLKVTPNRQLIGKSFKKEQTILYEALENLSEDQKQSIEDDLMTCGHYTFKTDFGQTFPLTRDMIKFVAFTKTITEENYIPHVIEPSFGLGRLLHCVLEHNFKSRGLENQEERCYFSIPPSIAPYKCSILPISNNVAFNKIVDSIRESCLMLNLSCKVDATSASIGKRYARTDEIGIPFAITIDFQTLKDNTVTLRERDSMEQIRLNINQVSGLILQMVQSLLTWSDATNKYPVFLEQDID